MGYRGFPVFPINMCTVLAVVFGVASANQKHNNQVYFEGLELPKLVNGTILLFGQLTFHVNTDNFEFGLDSTFFFFYYKNNSIWILSYAA